MPAQVPRQRPLVPSLRRPAVAASSLVAMAVGLLLPAVPVLRLKTAAPAAVPPACASAAPCARRRLHKSWPVAVAVAVVPVPQEPVVPVVLERVRGRPPTRRAQPVALVPPQLRTAVAVVAARPLQAAPQARVVVAPRARPQQPLVLPLLAATAVRREATHAHRVAVAAVAVTTAAAVAGTRTDPLAPHQVVVALALPTSWAPVRRPSPTPLVAVAALGLLTVTDPVDRTAPSASPTTLTPCLSPRRRPNPRPWARPSRP